MKLRFITASIAMAAALCASAQEAAPKGDFNLGVALRPYLDFSNAAALSNLAKGGGFTTIHADATKGNGDYLPLEGSNNSVGADAATESFMRVNDRIAFHGMLSYDYFTGLNMGGPILMDPSYNPVGFYEADNNNRGRKNRELYHLIGGISCDLGSHWAIGAEFDFESGNQVKVKDPRFSNVWMDLNIRPAVWFRVSDRNAFGLSAHYRSTLENVVGGIYGTTDTQYNIFTDKGVMLGLVEALSGDYNYLPENSSRPMRNNYYGGALQYSHTSSFELHTELKFDYRSGEYGKRTSNTPVFFEFSGVELDYSLTSLFGKGRLFNKLGLTAGFKTLSNSENHFQYVTPQGQNTVVEYSGQDRITDRTGISAGLCYRGWIDKDAVRPLWEFGLDVDGTYRSTVLNLYPIKRTSECTVISAGLGGTRNFISGRNCFAIGLNARFGKGFGNPCTETYLATVSSTSLKSFDDYLNRQFEYDTAANYGAGIRFCYTRFLKKVAAFVAVQDDFRGLTAAPQYLDGSTYNLASLSIGCNF